MKNTILIDLGNTLIYNKRISFQDGDRYLYNYLDVKEVTLNSFLKTTNTILKSMFKDRNTTNIEVPFTSYLKEVIEKFAIKSDVSLEKLEELYYKSAITDEVIPDAIAFLKFLKTKNYQVYIISNSTFSSRCLKWSLDLFGITEYIDGLYSSSDIGFRKPDKAFFEEISELKKMNKDEAIMIGNDYYFDFEFAKNIGVDFLWYNENNLLRTSDEFCYETHTYSDLIRKWGEIID